MGFVRFFAREDREGLIWYGDTAVHGKALHPLRTIVLTTDGDIPPPPQAPAQPAEHEAWLAQARAVGCKVDIHVASAPGKKQ
jgi:hypothetical protein